MLAAVPDLRRSPLTWVCRLVATLGFVLVSGDWRSPFYLLWLASLALPATALPLAARRLARGSRRVDVLRWSRIVGGPVPGRLQLVSTETLAIHVSLPFMLVVVLAYAAEALRRLCRRALRT